MLKTKDVPQELRPLNKAFGEFGYKYDDAQLFDDLLTIIICCYGWGTNEDLYFETIKRYEKADLNIFAKMLGELIMIYDRNNKNGSWCDPLGNFYEVLASRSKKSRLGQFFTPEPLCNLMAQLVMGDGWGRTINEPCSGSGRIVLAANHKANGNYYVCQDLDPICVKMTAINLCFHKIRGEVHCMDVLHMEKPRFSYAINHQLWKNDVPHIIQIKPS